MDRNQTESKEEHLVHPEEMKEAVKPDSKAGRNILFAVAIMVVLIIIFILWHPWSNNSSAGSSGTGTGGVTAPR